MGWSRPPPFGRRAGDAQDDLVSGARFGEFRAAELRSRRVLPFNFRWLAPNQLRPLAGFCHTDGPDAPYNIASRVEKDGMDHALRRRRELGNATRRFILEYGHGIL